MIEMDIIKKIRVLQFTIAASKGGQTQYILNLWKHIDRSRFSFDFITFAEKLNYEDELIEQGCKVYHLVYPEKDINEFTHQFRQICSLGYEIIEINTSYWKSMIVEEIAKECGIPRRIIHSHGVIAGKEIGTDNYDMAMKLHYNIRESISDDIATDYWGCSVNALKWLFPKRIVENRGRVIPNTIDTERFKFDEKKRKVIRKEENLVDRFVIGFVGRIEYIKNPFFLVKIMAGVSSVIHNALLIVIGDGSVKVKLIEEFEKQGLLNNVSFVPFTNEIERYYLAMDVFVQPSIAESFSISALEAQCAGLQCIVSAALPDEVLVTNNIKKLPIDDVNMWIDEIEEICASTIIRGGMDRVIKSKGYSTTEWISELEELYLGLDNK